LSISSKQLENASIDYVFYKHWNHDFTDCLPLVLSKITKKKIIIYKIINDQTFEQYNVSYSSKYRDSIYLSLENEHYRAILWKNSSKKEEKNNKQEQLPAQKKFLSTKRKNSSVVEDTASMDRIEENKSRVNDFFI